MPKSSNLHGNNGGSNKQKFLKTRLKNVVFWSAILALIMQMSFGNLIKLPDNFEQTVNAFLNVLVVAGILNNPTTKSQSLLVDSDEEEMDNY